MKKKKVNKVIRRSEEWKEEEKRLRGEVFILLARSAVLKQNAIKCLSKIEGYNLEYPDEVFDIMSWEEKDEVVRKSDDLMVELLANEEELREVDELYRLLCIEVNKFYGREVMKVLPQLPAANMSMGDEGVGDEIDPANWWKE